MAVGFNVSAAQEAVEKAIVPVNHNEVKKGLGKIVTYSYEYSPAPFGSTVLVKITRIRFTRKDGSTGVFYKASATFSSSNTAINGMTVDGMTVSNGENGPRVTMPGDKYTPAFVSSPLMSDLKDVIVKEVARKLFNEELIEDEREELTGDKIILITSSIFKKAFLKVGGLLKAFGADPESVDDWVAESIGDQIFEVSRIIGYHDDVDLDLRALEVEETITDEDETEVPF